MPLSVLISLTASKYTVGEEVSNPDAIMVRSAKMHDMEFGSNLLAIARAGAGVNNIPVDKCAESGIVVFNSPGANANAVKELAICARFCLQEKLPKSLRGSHLLRVLLTLQRQLKAVSLNLQVLKSLARLLGVIGLGAIGGKIANAAVDLGMKVVGYDPYLSVNGALHLDPSVKVVTDINEIYTASDYITIHVPYTPDTKNTIDAEQIAMMKDGVRLINLARGELINSEAVVKAIADR